MKILLLLLAVAAILVVLIKAKGAGSAGGSDDGPWPFHARKPLSNIEQVLYFRLVSALPGYLVLAQVGLSRLLEPDKGSNVQAWNNRINRMSADFVICNRDSTIVAVIELDDASHNKAHRQAADEKKNKAFAAAGIRLLRWQARALPDEATIRAALV